MSKLVQYELLQVLVVCLAGVLKASQQEADLPFFGGTPKQKAYPYVRL